MTPEIEAAIKREEYFRDLAAVIEEWESDPRDYDLRLVAHELQKATGTTQARPMRLAPGEFIALLGRCQRRGATPAVPVPPKSARELRQELERQLLEEQGVLLPGRERFAVPAAFRGPWPLAWEPVEAAGPADAISRAVIFERPEAPEGELLLLTAEMGRVPDAEERQVWYRLYFVVHWHAGNEVQILAEGTTTTVSVAQRAVSRKLDWFLLEQCKAELLLDEPLPPPRTEVYFVTVPVRLGHQDAKELSRWRTQAEMSAVISDSLRRYARRRRKLREARKAKRQAKQSKKETREEPDR